MKFRKYLSVIMKNLKMVIGLKLNNIPRLMRFYRTYWKYKHLSNTEKISFIDLYPCITDNTPTTPFDHHYFYQAVWAFRKILEKGAKGHVDVGSEINFIGILSNVTNVTFIDIRPFETDLKNLTVKKGSILSMPFEDETVDSLSCLHVAEHIGLGRYGDELDPEGTKKACEELKRILAVDGNLCFSVPVGKEKTYFNAHRVHSPKTILEYFKELDLIELSAVTDHGKFIENIDLSQLENSRYACGLFLFKK